MSTRAPGDQYLVAPSEVRTESQLKEWEAGESALSGGDCVMCRSLLLGCAVDSLFFTIVYNNTGWARA